MDVGGELWRRLFRPRLLRQNCGACRLFGDINPKVGPGQVSDLEQQKLSEVQSQHGVQWLVTHEFQKDLQRPDNAVFGKQRDMGGGEDAILGEQGEKINSTGFPTNKAFLSPDPYRGLPARSRSSQWVIQNHCR